MKAQRAGDGWTCEVEVATDGDRTRHTVTVARADLERWGNGTDSDAVVDLVRRSFDFLLEREPPGSILRSFQLSVIQTYFPDYDQHFKR